MRAVKSIFKISEISNNTMSSNNIYPEDYEPGKEYGRDVLAPIFAKLTGFPEIVAREAFFPLLPGGVEPMNDPKAMQVYGPNPITIEQFAKTEKEKYKSWNLENVKLSWDNLSDEFKKFVKLKQEAPGYEKRINFQRKRIEEAGMDPQAIITDDEPIMIEEKNGKYTVVEGMHRSLTILEMLKNKEFGNKNSVTIKAYVGHKK